MILHIVQYVYIETHPPPDGAHTVVVCGTCVKFSDKVPNNVGVIILYRTTHAHTNT